MAHDPNYRPTPQSRRVAEQKKKRAVENPDADPVRYLGLPEYVEEAADAAGVDDPEMRTRAAVGWHADAINTALSQLVEQAKDGRLAQLPGGSVAEVLGRVDLILESLDVQREALAAAVADVKAIVGEPDKMAKPTDDRKALNGARVPRGVSDPSQPGAHHPDRPSPKTPEAKESESRAADEGSAKQGRKKAKAEKTPATSPDSPRPTRSPQGVPVDPPVDARRPILPPADVDGDGDEESIPDPGSVDAPNYPTPQGDVEGDGQDDKAG